MTRKGAPAHVLRAYLTVAVVAAIPAALASAADTPAPPTTLANLIVAKDLSVQLAKFRQVHMAFDAQALSSRERQMVEKLVEASRPQPLSRRSDPDRIRRLRGGSPHAESGAL